MFSYSACLRMHVPSDCGMYVNPFQNKINKLNVKMFSSLVCKGVYSRGKKFAFQILSILEQTAFQKGFILL